MSKKKPYSYSDRNPSLDKRWHAGDCYIEVVHHPGYYLGDWECTITHIPSKRQAHTGNDDWEVALAACRRLIQKKIKARRHGKLYMAIDSFFYKLKKHFFCAFFHRRDRCYPGVKKYNWATWHCDRCRGCNDGLGALLGEPIRGAWGQWYIYPIATSASPDHQEKSASP